MGRSHHCPFPTGQAYLDIFVDAVVVPMISLIALIALATLFGAF